MPNEIKTGDIVQLKSGGPKMTVTAVGNQPESGVAQHKDVNENDVLCTWFNPAQKLERVWFNRATITHAVIETSSALNTHAISED